jgi:hypothetical protein
MSDPTSEKLIPFYLWLMLVGGALVILPSLLMRSPPLTVVIIGTCLVLAGLVVKMAEQLKFMNSQVKDLRKADRDNSEN